MNEPTNAVLAEQIRHLERELVNHKKQSREEFREVHEELKANEKEIASTKAVVSEVNTSMRYVKEAVAEMKGLVNGFTELLKEHNKSVDKKIDTQSEKIDGFINSDKRLDSKKHLWTSILQVAGYITVAVLGYLASGKF